MRHAALIALTSCVALCSTVDAAPAVKVSWGKIGVSFEQYRNDAVKCGRAGYYTDVSKTEAASVFRRATSQLENNEAMISLATSPADMLATAARSGQIVQGTRPELRYRQVRGILVDVVGRCLSQLGYSRFYLTEEQQRHLRRFHLGSPERHAYLYGLATDQNVLRSQAV